MTVIYYNDLYNHFENINTFLSNFGDKIFNIHKEGRNEELIKGYSYKHIEAFLYRMAYDYCVNLKFVALDTLSNETRDEAYKRLKREYNYQNIQSNLAHKRIDLDKIFNGINIPNEEEE